MDTDDNPKAEVKKSIVASDKLRMVMGGVAVLALAILAALVFTRYEAGIPLAEAAPTSATTQFIPVTISQQNLANETESVPGHAQHAAPAQHMSQHMASMKRPAE